MPLPSKAKVGSLLFRRKLGDVLNTPQGNEIKSRNWRISDKYKGGYLKDQKPLPNYEEGPVKPVKESNGLDLLTQMELAAEEGKTFDLPLLKKVPLPPLVEPDCPQKEEVVEEEEEEEELALPEDVEEEVEEAEQDLVIERNIGLVEGKDEIEIKEIDKMEVFKAEFEDSLAHNDYLGALIVLLTAIFVTMYALVCDVAEELTFTAKRVVQKYNERVKDKNM